MAEASGDGSMQDRISALPDELLIHVLSHLRSREAVQTCVLARRWRDLWQWVPCIDVSFKEFADVPYEDDDEDDFEFKKFVNRLLMLRRPVDLEAFRLEYRLPTDTEYPEDDSADANLWIAHALQYKAQAVKVVDYNDRLHVAPAVFTSAYLKRLHICHAFLLQGFFKHLDMGCPVLEDLFVSNTSIQHRDIFSNTLKYLTLTDDIIHGPEHDHQPSISAPKLISLSVDGSPSGPRLPILKNMTSLETASIVLVRGLISNCNADDIKQFLGELSHVRSLDLCYGVEKVEIEKNYRWCPTFRNLTDLTLHSWCVHGDFYALIVFLQNSPSLKKLTLELNEHWYENGVIRAITGELEDRSFTCEQLEIVEIICSEGNELLPWVNQFLLDSGIRPDQMRVIYED
ncbi:hypothetical protein CFC21_103484 [Triticum aestivum]|uniref:F-box domain-containing protein n=3 Tax=Triticum TaxID=4564 RepID=A0A9R1C1E3_TRITD|nr:putative F-box/FBD/LRR-repeat protein At1g78760 [Triticum dicoccoides]XP_037469978.1 putative F-box/FBD/LRR-repeat protein At1g78760 [Triticum dicoccoides]XP_037469980.1 putative F-box/FBD/LRR-repeat protein At1g78760 [Triticum dicoccoides]XP_044436335.1 putative F-box/FBD/LRR-repeat protein At1g78760 [Triticum aestivum]VAI88890.1 unnamed protein product [Triticum turgidum subsp. durum]KAF7102326.1 hypothetical protein CFC21_103484 [Triticum aestivum]